MGEELSHLSPEKSKPQVYYFCGVTENKGTNKESFGLVRPSDGIPYVVLNQDSRLMRHCSHHSALYSYTFGDEHLHNLHNSLYQTGEPDMVAVNSDLFKDIVTAIDVTFPEKLQGDVKTYLEKELQETPTDETIQYAIDRIKNGVALNDVLDEVREVYEEKSI